MFESVNWQSVCKNVMTIDKEAEVLKIIPMLLYIINCFVHILHCRTVHYCFLHT